MLSKRTSPGFVIAVIALFFALGGGAGAVITKAVPLAKRALQADNAKRVGGQTASQVAARGAQAAVVVSPPGARPASAIADLIFVATLTGTVSVTADPYNTFYTGGPECRRALGGGVLQSSAPVVLLESFPYQEGSWAVVVRNPGPNAEVEVTTYAICVRA